MNRNSRLPAKASVAGSTSHNPRLSAGLSYGILSALDPEQRKAAEIMTGQVMIIAGPGTGKTRTLTHRIAHLVTSKTARPEQCLTLLLTRQACEEMTERLKKLLGKNASRVQALTFRDFGLMVLKEHRVAAGLPRGFRLADQEERREFAAKALQWPEEKIQMALRRLALTKRQGLAVEARSDEATLNTLFEEWRDHEGWLDEEDLLSLPLKLFEEHPEIEMAYREQFRFVSVDECQDLDVLGYRIIRHLVKADGNLCVIGDPDQAIQRCHGADVRFFLQFEKDFPFTHKVWLTRNYRSGDLILKAAAHVIAPISLLTDQLMSPLSEDPGGVEIFQVGTDRAEVEFIVRRIEKLTNPRFDDEREDGVSAEHESPKEFSDIAIFYRTAEQGVLFQEAFDKAGLPFRGLTAEACELESKRNVKFISLIPLDETKGLEFEVVFIAGCEDGLIPLKQDARADSPDMQDERRLLYVGMARAKNRLILTHASKRLREGQLLEQKITPFLKLIEQYLQAPKKSTAHASRKMAQKSQMDLF